MNARASALDRSVLDGFRGGNVSARPVPWFYRPALVLAAGAMLLLACVYLASIAGVVWATVWHASEHAFLLKLTHRRVTIIGLVLRLFLYGGPIIVGGAVTVVLIKPLLRFGEKEWTPYAVTRSNEPILFEFIERICVLMNAPVPTRVVLDLHANASARLRRGMFSFFSNDLVVTIGLPLVAALDARQFAGVLAHEFGHFAQTGAMRLSYIVASLSRWLARVVYERDEWDVALTAASGGGRQTGLILGITNVAVWIVRGVLWLLMVAGQAVGCALSRQMEYDADRYEAAIAGSDAFISTGRRMHDLYAACESTYASIFYTFQEQRRLPVNLPGYLVSVADNLPKPTREKLCRELAEAKTKLLDTHPSWSDRNRAVMAANEPGIFQAAQPASALFRNFESTSRLLTCMHYRQDLGLEVTEQNLVPAEQWQPLQPPPEAEEQEVSS
jgi:Zn-dependent protease with chaperone function